MAIKSGRVGVRPDQVDEYGRVVASDYLVDQLKEVLPPSGELVPLHVNLNGTFTPPSGVGYGPVTVNVPFDVDAMALGLKPKGAITLEADNIVAYAFTHKDITRVSCPNVTQIEEGAFSDCTQLTNISSTGLITALGNSAFKGCIRLTSVSMSAVETIGNECFSQCRDLASASFSHTTSIGTHAFEGCSNLSTVNMPLLSSIGMGAFKGCSLLPSFSNSLVDILNNDTFNGCSSLTYLSLPNCTRIGVSSVANCPNLEAVNLPKLTSIVGTYAFSADKKLVTVVLPSLTGALGNWTFNDCSLLETVDLGTGVNNLSLQSFLKCTKLNKLILRSSSVVALNNTNVFNNTPFASGGSGGTLYVPSALISSYQSASNWSTILGYANNSIQAIEGSAYENAYADGTPINS